MDKKAKRILFSTYWKNGWIDSANRSISAEDFLYAKSQGIMFDPLSLSHDHCVSEIVRLFQSLSLAQVTQAFVSTLGSRRLDLRSALASFVTARSLRPHAYTPVVSGTFYCDGEPVFSSYTCGLCRDSYSVTSAREQYSNEDINVLNFERLKWGGIRHGSLLYTYFDLWQLKHTEIPKPTAADIHCLKTILATIAASEPQAYPGALEQNLKEALPSNKAERSALIEILACSGVLRPKNVMRPVRGKSDWFFALHWRGEDQYCTKTVAEYFGAYL